MPTKNWGTYKVIFKYPQKDKGNTTVKIHQRISDGAIDVVLSSKRHRISVKSTNIAMAVTQAFGDAYASPAFQNPSTIGQLQLLEKEARDFVSGFLSRD